MQKCFLFSLCNGCYEYAIVIIQAETLEEACKIGLQKAEDDFDVLTASNNIQGYNYDYKDDIDKFRYLNYTQQLSKNWTDNRDLIDYHPVFKKSYSELLEASTDDIKNTLLNGSEYLFTNKSFYDVIECLMPVPKGYIYTNGHSG